MSCRFSPTHRALRVLLLLAATACAGTPPGPAATRPAPGGPAAAAPASPVRIWEEAIALPTYRVGPPDPNPIFYDGENYQGAQRHVYPYPLIDAVSDVRENRSWKAVVLENDYVRISVLPELGGRLFSALDKTDGYDFLYRQHVIKPALIGMLGAWISGGIEWCVFHHHRNTTFMPVDYTLVENADGSRTVWIGETERRHRMRWLIGLSLYPDRSYVEATVKIVNRTPLPHSMLYWANVAVHVGDAYQVIFPPSVRIGVFHGKNDFVHWPVATAPYRGIDYTGVDLSWWKNHPEPVSIFAWQLSEDFSGGYDHAKRAGVVHVGDHHVVSGAKLWEWGPGPRGTLWDGILTDTDGPYAELMVGAFSDNQPDYSWIRPSEVRTFNQYWYPIREIGGFKNANTDAAVNLTVRDGVASVGFNATASFQGARAILTAASRPLLERTIDIGPARPFVAQVTLPPGTAESELEATLLAPTGRRLIAYRPAKPSPAPELPAPVRPPPAPSAIKTTEELYLTGLRLQQINNPEVDPDAYYQEALRRDPGDARANTVAGTNLNRRGLFREAEQHLRRAIERLSPEYTRPGAGESHFQLGVALRGQGRPEAADAFHRATWDSGVRAAAFEQLAELSLGAGQPARAQEEIDRAIADNGLAARPLALKAAILRRLGRPQAAEEAASAALALDPLDFFALNERALARRAAGTQAAANEALADLRSKMRGEVQSVLELAADYGRCGLWDEAIDLLAHSGEGGAAPIAFPLVHYYLGYFAERKGDPGASARYYAAAAALPADYCFPFRLETADVLASALRRNPSDARAHYYLGNLLYELRPEEAIASWERARALDSSFSLVHRNLGWAYARTRGDLPKAIASYEKAIETNGGDPRLFLEIDRLEAAAGVAPEKRLSLLERHQRTVEQRTESLARQVIVLNLVGRYDDALRLLSSRHFHVEELSGDVHEAYVDAHLLRGAQRLARKDAAGALEDFQAAGEYPENLSVGRPRNDPRAAQVAYFGGLALEALGQRPKAEERWRVAAGQAGTVRWRDARLYQARALDKLGRKAEAAALLDVLAREADAELAARDKPVAARQARADRREAAAHRILGLVHLAKGDRRRASAELARTVALDSGDIWARRGLEEAR